LLAEDEEQETGHDVDVEHEHDGEEDCAVASFGLFALVERFQNSWHTLHTDELQDLEEGEDAVKL
jgi:hypothetical protein